MLFQILATHVFSDTLLGVQFQERKETAITRSNKQIETCSEEGLISELAIS